MYEDVDVTQPPFVGPPPQPPREPRITQPTHVLHLLLSVFTVGLWLPIWALVALDASKTTRYEHERYEQEQVEYRAAYDAWQYRHHQVYGFVPYPPA
jgi:hypothetical protein